MIMNTRTTFNLLLACLLGAGIAAPVLPAEDPIPGVDVIVEKVPPGNAVGRVTTDKNGMIFLRNLERGYYEVRDRENSVRAGIRHPGGAVRWQLQKDSDALKPTWVLVDVNDPL